MRIRRIIEILITVVLSPIVLGILAAVLLYVPAVQKWAVDVACVVVSEETGLDASVEGVHLVFPLDLSLKGVKCTQPNDSLPQVTDTIAMVGTAVVDVQLRPLFDGDVKVNAIELTQANLNTADFVHTCRVKGYVGRLLIDKQDARSVTVSEGFKKFQKVSGVATVALNNSVAKVGRVLLYDAHLDIALSDTVKEDTTKSENKWKIYVQDLQISKSSAVVHLPGDTLRVGMTLNDVRAKGGYFDLGEGLYDVAQVAVNKCGVTYENRKSSHLSAGFDANRILLRDVNVGIDSLHYLAGDTTKNRVMDMSCRIRHASMKEQSGIVLQSLRGTLKLDSTIYYDAAIDATVSARDVTGFLPREYKGLWPQYPLTVKGHVMGNLEDVTVPWITVTLPTAFDLQGRIKLQVSSFKFQGSRGVNGGAHVDVRTYNMKMIDGLLPRSVRRIANLSNMHASIDLTARGNSCDVALKANQGRGNMLVNASATANIKTMKGKVCGTLGVHNRLARGSVALKGLFGKHNAAVTLTTDMKKADLYRLNFVGTPLTIGLRGHLDIATDMKESYKVKGTVHDIAITDTAATYRPDDITLDLTTTRKMTKAKVECGDFALDLDARGSYRWLLGCGDRMRKVLKRHLRERTINQDDIRRALPYMTLSLKSGQQNTVYRMLRYYDVGFAWLNLDMKTSREDGIFADLSIDTLMTQGYRLDAVRATVTSSNDPKEIFYTLDVKNTPPSPYDPSTSSGPAFEAKVDGRLLEHGVSVNAQIYDEKQVLALKIGAEATMEENGIKLHLTPEHPVLGYETFTLNDSNYVLLGRNNRIHANVDLLASDGAGLKVYCSDENLRYENANENANENLRYENANANANLRYVNDNVDVDVNENDEYLQDLTLSLNKLDIGRICASLPYLPKVEGKMNGDFHVMQNKDQTFTLSSDMVVNNMYYEGCKIGNLGSQFTYFPKSDGTHYVDGILTLDDNEVGSINGSYNLSSSAIDAKVTFERFPLSLVDGFVPEQLIGLEGTAEGELKVEGTTEKPIVNGELYVQDAALLSVPYGVRLSFDNDPVRIQDSKLLLENFQMYAPNKQPLVIYGDIDFADLDKINVDMKMKAKNFQLINAKENLRSEAYGKVFVNAYASMKGDVSRLQMRGRLEVLPSTDLYYILRDSPITTDNTMKELVEFTDLSDTTKVIVKRPQVNGMSMSMNVVVDQGAHLKAWLDGSHTNYLDIIGNGDLRLTYKNEQMGMSGRYTITEGEMKYSLPVIPLKTFTIQDGSYLNWTGDIMNPRLSITALETIKSSVYLNNVNQMVTFNTGVRLSKTLNDMGLEFLIEAPENKDVAEELSMRSAEERGKLAVTLLTTGMYFSDGNTSNFSMNSAMNTFLQSQINNIAGSALKTVDLSFGMESSTEQDGTRHNDYTFKFAKRFWNNRLSIAVGGKISSGPDVSGQNKSFFNNVELQYRLSDNSNKYLQMFYKRNVYDYLEGYLSQFGAGFMWKKNAQSFGELFRSQRKEKGKKLDRN